MKAEIKFSGQSVEFYTAERCFIQEVANDAGDPQISIARARVAPGVTTAWHQLDGISERYIIVSGTGRVQIGRQAPPVTVSAGDVVRIPADTPQRIANHGSTDLIFYAVCVPPFRQTAYVALETG
ncbi:cupin domain-containing protein [Desulfatitalea alkaliphila]|uniref:Cupin domain-containing protein n=1 Tax=Desulfatitalea alkaliphila TaxID=2929485 RepID=A0AA41UMS4_9BACT|nr:cupin domain-containing protein [Desulfatitalea alkaliphila]MCJ8502951.1 cupin domain-containing protein [Desulfatitalea alkaliphila]